MKRIVLCCDGTWNRADQQTKGAPTPTNVVRAAYLIAKATDKNSQIICYDEGVGTGNTIDRLTGGAFGHGLDTHIFEAYRFLIANYEPGDEIYIFGFSRGAFTARSISGMIRKCGILKRLSVNQYHAALALYRDQQHPDAEGAGSPKAFRAAHSIAGTEDIPIKFIGVWDTVGALGIPLRGLRALTRKKHQFHDTELSGTVQNAYHALAIDERRAPFAPTLWTFKPKPGQTVKQTWFSGVHSDVGGGFAERGLSDIALEWMLAGAQSTGLGLDQETLDAFAVKPDPFARVHPNTPITKLPWLGVTRPIGLVNDPKGGVKATTADPTQSVHDAVLQRWDKDHTYRPPNLRAYLKLTGDPRATS